MKHTDKKMNIDKILNQKIKYNYLDKVESALKAKSLTFKDLKCYERCGRSKNGLKPDTIFKNKFGENVKPPDFKYNCLCGHSIVEQCYLCPEGSNNINDVITLGNHCINKWGFNPAIRGKIENKVKCDLCGSLVNKKGFARHKKTQKCKNNAINKNDNDNTTESTKCSDNGSVSSDN